MVAESNALARRELLLPRTLLLLCILCWFARNAESQRDSDSKPRVASLRATLGKTRRGKQPQRGCGHTGHDPAKERAATPWGLLIRFDAFPGENRTTVTLFALRRLA